MHDESLERRLRATLRDEADRQPFTITAAELERRVVLRGRATGNRRLTFLLAAAVAVGALGVGGVVGGVLENPEPTPQPSPVAQTTDAPQTATPEANLVALPVLDALIAMNLSGRVVFAQSDGPPEGPEPIPGTVSLVFAPPFVRVDLPQPDGIYAITLACRGGAVIVTSLPDAADPDLDMPCDGRVRHEAIDVEGGQALELSFSEQSSWRVVVRHPPSTGPTTPPDPAELEAPAGHQTLVSVVNETTASGTLTPSVPGMLGMTRGVGVVAPRLAYVAQASCVGGSAMRFAFGDDAPSEVSLTTTTQIRCDGLAHSVRLGIAEPSGRKVFVGAEPTVRWSLLVSSTEPPVSLASDVPGWKTVAGIGPDLEFGATILSFAGLAVDGGGPLMVALDCAGVGPIEVSVDVRASEGSGTFIASCSPEGQVTRQTFEAPSYESVRAAYQATAGQWTALSILVPDAAVQQP